MNFGEHLLRPSALLALANFLSLLRVSATLLGLKICCQNSPNLRDRKKITVTLLEGKFHSSIDDFPLQVEPKLSAAEKSSKPERLSSSTTVTFISLRSLSFWRPDELDEGGGDPAGARGVVE